MSDTITLLCPTRGRPQAAAAMWQSAVKMAAEPDKLSVTFRTDWDDSTNRDTLMRLLPFGTGKPRMRVISGPRKRGYLDLGAMLNEAAAHSTGAILGFVNDDVQFTRHGWDETLRLTALSSGLTCWAEEHHEFPFVTRSWVGMLGFITDPREVHNDTFITDVAKRAGCLVHVPTFMTAACLDDKTYHEAQAQVKEHGTPHHFDDPDHVAWRVEAAGRLHGN